MAKKNVAPKALEAGLYTITNPKTWDILNKITGRMKAGKAKTMKLSAKQAAEFSGPHNAFKCQAAVKTEVK